MSGSLEGRVALVTGASRGIGHAVAVALARAGASVAVTARTLHENGALAGSLESTLADVRAAGADGVALVADLADDESRADLVARAAGVLGPVDVLVNNAAAALYAPVADMPLRRRRLLFEVNVHAPVDLAQQALPAMTRAGRGSIVNVTSAAANHRDEGGVAITPYGASKAALDRFTEGLAAEVAAAGVSVHGVAPVGGVDTPGARVVLGDRYAELSRSFEPLDGFVGAVMRAVLLRPVALGRAVLTSADLSGSV